MSVIRRIPVPMSALALGIAALGNLLLPYSADVRTACGVVAATLVVLIVARIAVDFTTVREELESPAILSALPALFMALMILATYLKPVAPPVAQGLWIVALVSQLLVAGLFAVRFVGSFKLAQVLPGWFLVFVGFVAASVTSPAFGAQPLGQVLLYAGVAGYVAILPLAVYRMVKVGDLPAPVLPTVAIFAAPPSLILAGYLAVTQAKDVVVVYVLLALAGASLLYVLTRLPRILTNSFCPSCAALTFPIVITAIALKQSNAFLATTTAGSFIPVVAVQAMDVLAVASVVYVLVRYVMLLASPEKGSASS